jgi:LmbE family N-acetylglucosaminyl deacetylase
MFPHFHSFGENEPSKDIWQVAGVAFYNTAYPNTFVNVDGTWNLKMDAISAHGSQFSGPDFEILKMYFGFKSGQLAEGRGFSHAEAFKVLTPTLLHGNVDAINW